MEQESEYGYIDVFTISETRWANRAARDEQGGARRGGLGDGPADPVHRLGVTEQTVPGFDLQMRIVLRGHSESE